MARSRTLVPALPPAPATALTPAPALALALALALAAGLGACGRARRAEQPTAPPPLVAQLLGQALERARKPAAVRRHGERLQAWNALLAFYRQRGDQPAWWDPGSGVGPAAGELLAALDGLAAEGLDPHLYSREELRRLLAEATAPEPAPAAGGTLARTGAPAGESSQLPPAAEAAAARIAHLDLGLTYAFLAAGAHLSLGRLQASETARMGWHLPRPRVDLAAALQGALEQGGGPGGRAGSGKVAAALGSLAPRAPDYARLRSALASYRALAARGGWPAIPAGPPLRRGDSGPRVAALAARLAASGDLPPGAAAAGAAVAGAPPAGRDAGTDAERHGANTAATGRGAGTTATATAPGSQARFDDALAAALARFQARHGLTADPAAKSVDAATLAALALPVERRIRQLELNMERRRWMADDLGPRYVMVNVPAFQANVVEQGRTVLAMRVIVGEAQRKTPLFSDLLSQIVLNPAWHIPDSIVAQEIAPHLASDPGYLRRKGIEVRREDAAGSKADSAALGADELGQLGQPGSHLRLRQPPGPENPLGRYKFVFPNRFDVYLHDTPAGELFARSRRTFSHGCIRIEKPDELARYLLAGDPKWTPEAVAAKLATGETETIALARPLPVYILYLTAWVDPDGTVNFRDDVYGQDAELDAALAAEPPLHDDLAALIAPPRRRR
jgi:L,D-transpeptidase YcbB